MKKEITKQEYLQLQGLFHLGCEASKKWQECERAIKAFRSPTIKQFVLVNDWDKGIDIEYVKFEERWITEEEAEVVRQNRIKKMKEILESQGYSVEQIEKELED